MLFSFVYGSFYSENICVYMSLYIIIIIMTGVEARSDDPPWPRFTALFHCCLSASGVPSQRPVAMTLHDRGSVPSSTAVSVPVVSRRRGP